jgi:hypothetical protein
LDKFLKIIQDDLDNFFEFKANAPLLFFLDKREDMNLIWGEKTETWFVGAYKNNGIYIFHPNAYERESTHKKEEFWQNLKHEYCHAYYTQITKGHYPIWLNEGLASFLSGKKLFVKKNNSRLLKVFDYFNRADRDVYMVGQFWVEYLLKKYGKKRFLKLISSLRSGLDSKQFAKIFFNIYGFKFNKKYFLKFLD